MKVRRAINLLKNSDFNLRKLSINLVGSLLLSGAAAGQDLPTSVSTPLPVLPGAPSVLLKAQTPAYEVKAGNLRLAAATSAVVQGAAQSDATITSTGARLITLQQAQEKAAPASGNPMVRLGELSVEVARQTRLGTQATFFPQIGSTFENFHFNKFMGQTL